MIDHGSHARTETRSSTSVLSLGASFKKAFGYMRANNILVLSNDIMSEIEHKNYKTINEKVVLYMESGKLFIEEVKKYKESKK